MREEILEIIKNSNKPLEALDILYSMKNSKNNSAKELKELIDELNLMCEEGVLRTTKKQKYLVNELITGRVDLHSKGNAHIIMDNGEDIFIPKDEFEGFTSHKLLISNE